MYLGKLLGHVESSLELRNIISGEGSGYGNVVYDRRLVALRRIRQPCCCRWNSKMGKNWASVDFHQIFNSKVRYMQKIDFFSDC